MRLKAAVALSAIFIATGVMAHKGVKSPEVKARMKLMVEIGSEMKLLGDMMKGEKHFEAGTAKAAADKISVLASKIPDVFSSNATDPKSEALPAIWEHYENFVMMAGETEMAAFSASQSIETQTDLKAALGAIGATCKSCHGDYRQ